MKVFISADIEGVTAINHWDEAGKTHADYKIYQTQMQKEVVAACEGAIQGGATEIFVRDAHGSARNLDPSALPRSARLIRGWSGHPYCMVQGIDRTFTACIMIGYHARAGASGNPLAHTMNGAYAEIRVNQKPVSEFFLNAMTCELEGVPTVLVAGDQALMEEVGQTQESILQIATNQSWGQTTMALAHPDVILEQIRSQTQKALRPDHIKKCHLKIPEHFELEIDYKEHHKAYKASHYPNAELVSNTTVRLRSQSYYEVIRAIGFL